MIRRRPPFESTKKGFRCNLDADERHLVRRLIGEVRELLSTTGAQDPKLLRLFPPAYDSADDAEAEADYRRLMHEELVASRLDSLGSIDGVLGEDAPAAITEQQLHALATSLNSVRLILGTLLGLTDDDEDDFDESVSGQSDQRASTMALYHYLSWLLESAVSALTQSLE